MNPDQLFLAFTLILYDVFPDKELWKQTPATREELADVEERVKCLFSMNRAKLFGGANGNREISSAHS